jgi:hypothetical protein
MTVPCLLFRDLQLLGHAKLYLVDRGKFFSAKSFCTVALFCFRALVRRLLV